ncbi:MAG TPA: hypothetical protein VMV90_00550 [Rectinemataceae bacterium]|nr:hypothetical protein [Rectinemataceae bacterium]
MPYTVIGNPKAPGASERLPVSVVLLNRGNRLYRNDIFRELDKFGFDSVLSVEEGPESRDVEALAARYPRSRFLVISGKTSPGEQINLGMRESSGLFVFVLWSDMRLSTQGLSSRFFERVAEQNILCQAPFLSSREGDLLPAAAAPALHRASLKVLALSPAHDGERSLYPFDYCGIYSREKFVQTGGFDAELRTPYWQKLDFGFRSWLWGEELHLAQALKVNYVEDVPAEDSTPDECYKWFWLKNLAPVFKSDSALIPASRLWAYLRRRSGGPFAGAAEFRSARDWVRLNRYRFRFDAASLVDLWGETLP